jgi:hypothetical protein
LHFFRFFLIDKAIPYTLKTIIQTNITAIFPLQLMKRFTFKVFEKRPNSFMSWGVIFWLVYINVYSVIFFITWNYFNLRFFIWTVFWILYVFIFWRSYYLNDIFVINLPLLNIFHFFNFFEKLAHLWFILDFLIL